MDTPQLEVGTRNIATKAKDLRGQGIIPMVYYGKNIKPQHLGCNYEKFRKLYRTAGENTVIELIIDGKEKANILIQEVQMDPVRNRYNHVDVINVNMNEEIYTMIPIILEGVAPAVKDLGGTLIQSLDELEVKCLPKDIPHEIKGSVEGLIDFHTSLHVSDLIIPAGVTIINEMDQTVATVTAIQEEKAATIEPEATTEGSESANKPEAAKKE